VYVADPEILHRIFFKDSDCFRDKPERDYGHKIINEMLDFVNGEIKIIFIVIKEISVKRFLVFILKLCWMEIVHRRQVETSAVNSKPTLYIS
jgi:hypothetical protein